MSELERIHEYQSKVQTVMPRVIISGGNKIEMRTLPELRKKMLIMKN